MARKRTAPTNTVKTTDDVVSVLADLKEAKSQSAKSLPLSLEGAMEMIRTQYGNHALCGMGTFRPPTRPIPTDFYQLDTAVGGGVSRGRHVTIWGPPGVGKSTLALAMTAAYQRCCRVCGSRYRNVTWTKLPDILDPLTGEYYPDYEFHRSGCRCADGVGVPMRPVWIDMERALDIPWAVQWGVSPKDLLIFEPEYGEQAVDMGAMALASGDCDFLVLDSLAAMVPKAAMLGSAEDQFIGAQARLLSRMMQTWGMYQHSLGPSSRPQPTVVALSQVRVNIKATNPNAGYIMTGGKAVEHKQDLVIRLSRPEKNAYVKLPNDMVVGQTVDFKVEKNRLAPPKRMGQYTLYFVDDPREDPQFRAGTTDVVAQVLTAATWWGLATVEGGNFKLPGFDKPKQIKSLKRYFSENPSEFEALKAAIADKERQLASGSLLVPPDMLFEDDPVEVDEAAEAAALVIPME